MPQNFWEGALACLTHYKRVLPHLGYMPKLIAVGQTVQEAYVWRFAGKLGPLRPAFQCHSRSSELIRIDPVPMTFRS